MRNDAERVAEIDSILRECTPPHFVSDTDRKRVSDAVRAIASVSPGYGRLIVKNNSLGRRLMP